MKEREFHNNSVFSCLNVMGRPWGKPTQKSATNSLYTSLLKHRDSYWWCWYVVREPFFGIKSKVFQQLLEVLKQKALLMSHMLLRFHQHVKNPHKSNSAFLTLKGALWIAPSHPITPDSKCCFSAVKRKLIKKYITIHLIFIFNHKDGAYFFPRQADWAESSFTLPGRRYWWAEPGPASRLVVHIQASSRKSTSPFSFTDDCHFHQSIQAMLSCDIFLWN